MKVKMLTEQGKQKTINFWGFYKRITQLEESPEIEIVALVSDEEGFVDLANPRSILFPLKDSDRLQDYLS